MNLSCRTHFHTHYVWYFEKHIHGTHEYASNFKFLLTEAYMIIIFRLKVGRHLSLSPVRRQVPAWAPVLWIKSLRVRTLMDNSWKNLQVRILSSRFGSPRFYDLHVLFCPLHPILTAFLPLMKMLKKDKKKNKLLVTFTISKHHLFIYFWYILE